MVGRRSSLLASVLVAGIFGSGEGKRATKSGRAAARQANARLRERQQRAARPEDAARTHAEDSELAEDV